MSSLLQLELVNFRQLRHATAVFHPNLTLVAGRNGEGKSSLLHAIQCGLGAEVQNVISTAEDADSCQIKMDFADEQTIQRALTATTSEYKVNGKPLPASKTDQLPTATLIAQQMTDQLLHMSGLQRLKELERTLNVKNYESKKSDIGKQIETASKKKAEASQLLTELAEKVEELHVRAEEYQKWLDIQAKIKSAEAALKKLDGDEIKLKNSELENQKQMLEKQIDIAKREMNEKQLNLKDIGEKLEQSQIQIAQLIFEIDQLKQGLQKLIEAGFSEENGDNSVQIDKITNDLSKIEKELGSATTDLAVINQQIDLSSKKKNSNQLKEEFSQNLSKIKSLQHDLTEINSLTLEDKALVDLEKQHKSLQQQLKPQNSDLQKEQALLNQFILKKERTARKLQETEYQCQKSLQELFQLYPSKVTSPLKYLKDQPGYIGLFGELIEVDEHLFNVMENAAGGLLLQVVVDTRDNAIRMTDTLRALSKQNDDLKNTRLNLIALEDFGKDQQQISSFQTQIQSQENAVSLATLIQCDERIQSMVNSYFSRVLVVRSFNLAAEFSRQFNADCYTVEGDCILTSGLVTAGHHSSTKMKSFCALIKAQLELNKAEAAHAELERDSVLQEEKVRLLQRKEVEIDQANSDLQQNINIIDQQIQKIKTTTLSNQKKKQDAENSIHQLEQQNYNITQAINEAITYNKDELLHEQKAIQVKIQELQRQQRDKQQNLRQMNDNELPMVLKLLAEQLKQQYSIKKSLLIALKQLIIEKEKTCQDAQDRLSALSSDETNSIRATQQLAEQSEQLNQQMQQISDSIYLNNAQLQILPVPETQAELPAELQTRSAIQQYIHVQQQRQRKMSTSTALIFETYQLQNEKLLENQTQLEKLQRSEDEIRQAVKDLESKHQQELQTNFEAVNTRFQQIGQFLTGSGCHLAMDDGSLEIETEMGANLSGGQQAAVSLSLALAIALSEQSSILMMDEPDANLDVVTRERLRELLRVTSESVQIIVTSFQRQMADVAGCVLLVQNGEITQVKPDDIGEGVWAE